MAMRISELTMLTYPNGYRPSRFLFVLLGPKGMKRSEEAAYSGFVFWAIYVGICSSEW